MKPQDLRIEVKSDPESLCNVLEHFTQNWVNATNMHPKIKKVRYFTAKGNDDYIKVIDTDGNTRLNLEGNDALRLDLLHNEILKMVG